MLVLSVRVLWPTKFVYRYVVNKNYLFTFFCISLFFSVKTTFFFSPSKVGDQLLDVCGINLRSSGEEHAKLILQNSGKSIYMKVQYNPVDYHSMLALGKRKNHNSNALIIQYKPRSLIVFSLFYSLISRRRGKFRRIRRIWWGFGWIRYWSITYFKS